MQRVSGAVQGGRLEGLAGAIRDGLVRERVRGMERWRNASYRPTLRALRLSRSAALTSDYPMTINGE
ncbi:hypothetical protein CJO79_16820 (plasmid) [Ralstonia solanacearum]|uniref:Uncharacterized protein n=2 Tax=Ralstonia syzygii subsp. celebesensis TaxID=1310168 RepID=A0A1U9VQG0_9RALS|nr:hypothetical protein B0B51_21985 [blood disease bacterium A2-HR MARDI]AXV78688.1 hypothetical protein CJO76_16835 [Ralstonia solanacearum]CCA83497.1 hypothethical protein [blood disease bacterium R229]AXV92710.1 hypothetical protein CJO79_16820 [Ralstonia solanacearum]AXW20784.1 hypothetical protein CJO85_16865 [Ralstonia solanacearum]